MIQGKPNERKLNIVQLTKYILKKWMFVIALSIICGIILGGVKYAQDKRYKESDFRSIESLKESLSEEDLQKIYYAMDCYNLAEQGREYMESSIKFNSDTLKVPVMNMQWIIELNDAGNLSEEEQLRQIDNIQASYHSYVLSGALASDIYNNSNKAVEAQYINEIIAYENEVSEEYDSNVVLKIKECDKIENIEELIIQCMDNYAKNLNVTLYNHKLKYVSTYKGIEIGNVFYSDNQNMINNINNLESKYNSAKNAFSENQLEYFNYLMNMDIPNESGNLKVKIDWKYIVIGMLFGVCLAIFILVIKIQYSKYIIDEFDYQTMFDLKKLSTVDKEFNDLDFLIFRMKKLLKDKNLQQILLLSSVGDYLSQEKIPQLLKKAKKEGINLVYVNNIFQECMNLDIIYDIEKCILIEELGITKVKDMYKLVEFCRDNNIYIEGVISVE